MNPLFLACGSMRFTPEQEAFFGSILLAVLAFWLFSAIAAYLSFCFLLNPKLGPTFKAINRWFLAVCILVLLSPFLRMWINDIWTGLLVFLGVPLLIISQFLFLMVIKGKLRRKHESMKPVQDDRG